MKITYKINKRISAAQFVDLLNASTLAERRPVDDKECIEGMLKNTNLIITAWDAGKLVGVSRSVTDFVYCCYLSDLAVHNSYQGLGIGKKLQDLTQRQLGPRCTLILLAAPKADGYYEHIGFKRHPLCWVLNRTEKVK